MKLIYTTFFFTFYLLAPKVDAQTVTKLYDHSEMGLHELFNMPWESSRLLVVSGYEYSPDGVFFHELDPVSNQLTDITFSNIDTILSPPEVKGDKIFFKAHINGLGKEIVVYDGTSTYFFDFNIGLGGSNPVIFQFEDEIYVTAKDGTVRQLYFYDGSSFQQISEETQANVIGLIGKRGNEHYYYTTNNSPNGRTIKTTNYSNGTLSHYQISMVSNLQLLRDVVLYNDDIYMLSENSFTPYMEFKIDKIDLNNTLTNHLTTVTDEYNYGNLFEYDGELLYYGRGEHDILNVTTSGQSFIVTSIDQNQFTLGIVNHHIQNDQLFVIGSHFILNVSNPNPISVIENVALIAPHGFFEIDSFFYVYQTANSFGTPSGIIQVNTNSNQATEYYVSDSASSLSGRNLMVENNDQIKFLFLTSEGAPSTDIFALSPPLSVDENHLETFKPFPNPVTDGRFSITLPSAGIVHILTIEGQMIKSSQLDPGVNTIYIEDLSAGVYLVQYRNAVERLVVN